MKNYTAIQNTEYLQGVGYSFKANNLEEAKEKAKSLMTGEITDVYEVDDLGQRIVTLEYISEKLEGKIWEKGDLKRVYLNEVGYNTKKMTTKVYVYEQNGSFRVNVYIDCPSQSSNWIQSQKEEIIERIERKIYE